jgi:predicted methyltransferase
MKRFVVTLIGLKLWLLLVFATLFFAEAPTALEPTAAAATATPTPAASIDKTTRKTSEPYTGDLSIFEGAERAKNLQIDRVMDILGITENKAVADVGAGSGWFTVLAAKRVGPGGKVFAVEINKDFVEHINKRAKSEGFSNITTILGTADDPKLAADSVDAVMVLKTYHEIAEPVALMKKLRKAMKKGGLVGIIDRAGDGADHGLDADTVIKEMKQAGFSLKGQYDFVKPDNMDYFLVFE